VVRHSDGKRRYQVASYVWFVLASFLVLAAICLGYYSLLHLGGSK